jgi:DNA-directed RNA polymerase specialized sigma subunit
VRPDRELLEETLDTVRSFARRVDGLATRTSSGASELGDLTLDAAWRALPEPEQTVIEMRYGLHGETPKTLEDIGNLLGVTRERVRQIEQSGVSILAGPSPGMGFDVNRETLEDIRKLLAE